MDIDDDLSSIDSDIAKLYSNGSSIDDPCWQCVDLNRLLKQLNQRFFWGRLNDVEVEWSNRMTQCAGACYFEPGGPCLIRLSKPLLKLRSRKDLMETMLHEMIHAFLFVTANNNDHNAHGPEFLSHMQRINKSSGTNVTVYHNFDNEADKYLTHVWLCDGPCREEPPFYGTVKRAINREPGPSEAWWNEHRVTCGGTFVKIKQPKGYVDKRRKQDDDWFLSFDTSSCLVS